MAKSQENRLAFAAWLLFFRDQGRFPRDASDLELVEIPALARQLEVTAPTNGAFPVAKRTATRLRSEIRARYAFREATIADAEALTQMASRSHSPEAGGEITPTVDYRSCKLGWCAFQHSESRASRGFH